MIVRLAGPSDLLGLSAMLNNLAHESPQKQSIRKLWLNCCQQRTVLIDLLRSICVFGKLPKTGFSDLYCFPDSVDSNPPPTIASFFPRQRPALY